MSNNNISLNLLTPLQELLKKHSIISVTSHSAEAKKGYAFVAIKGAKSDGNDFIENVIKQRVSFVITDNKQRYDNYKNLIPIYLVENSRKTLAEISTLLSPQTPENLLAVTGTSGKSSTVHYVAQLLSFIGKKAATIGTLGTKLYHFQNNIEIKDDTGLTTPDIITLNKNLTELKKNNVDYCVLEASSIGIDQYRIYGHKFKAVAFTSFSQDHLDYHGNMKTYLTAKLKLFESYIEENSVAIINSDMNEYSYVSNYLKTIGRKQISVGKNGDYKIIQIKSSADGQQFELFYNNKSYPAFTSILGEFQIYNIVIAIALLASINIDINELIPYIPNLTAPAGRLERVNDSEKGSRIFIDYSHKPDALENVLKELRAIVDINHKKLIIVFGCGGDRDKIKRPVMGDIAVKYAHKVIITDDNPRSEDAAKIRQEILTNAIGAIEIGDRREAIKYAITLLSDGDLLLIAGKGHEDYQIIGEKTFPFSDKAVALEFI